MMLMLLGLASIAAALYLTFINAYATTQGSGQSKLESLKEAWTNIAIGFSINYVANLLLLPLVGAHVGLVQNFWLGCIYTTISLIRQYVIRRRFNARMVRQQAKEGA